MHPKIFISHASSDEKLALCFLRLIESGISISSDEIFCTSSASQGVNPGKNFTKEIQSALMHCEVAIALISQAFYDSTYCLCELGAIWGRAGGCKFIPVLIPPINPSDMKAVISGLQSIQIDKPSAMHQLFDRLVTDLGLSATSATRWNHSLSEFLAEFPKFYRNSSRKRVRGETFLNLHSIRLATAIQALITRLAPMEKPGIYLVVLDIDRQKQINCTHGIAIGDEVISHVAGIFAGYGSKFFEQGQCGDDTFFCIYVGQDIEVLMLAEELLGKVREISKFIGKTKLWVTASIGICEYAEGCLVDSWKSSAHLAMEDARQSGGNKVGVGNPPLPGYVETAYSWGS